MKLGSMPMKMPGMRKIVQISAVVHQGKDYPQTEVVALCDDGSVWSMFDTTKNEWTALAFIPQGVIGVDVG